jgi:holo-[acyl-carrier protein] synthase
VAHGEGATGETATAELAAVEDATVIYGIGVDLVYIARFSRNLERTPALRQRLFTLRERTLPDRSLAARFAAKEALIKALGGSDGITWQDLEIVRGEEHAPRFTPTPGLGRVLAARSIGQPWVSLAHETGMAVATVVLEVVAGEQ